MTFINLPTALLKLRLPQTNLARETIEKVYANGIRIAQGCGPDIGEAVEELNSMNLGEAMKDGLADMDLVSAELVA